MRRILASVFLLCWACLMFVPALGAQSSSGTVAQASDSPPAGILVELFTSEGCSSCPPADELLRTLDERRNVLKTEIVVLGEHVDTRVGTGWSDRISSRDYTEHQAVSDIGIGSQT